LRETSWAINSKNIERKSTNIRDTTTMVVRKMVGVVGEEVGNGNWMSLDIDGFISSRMYFSAASPDFIDS